MEPTNPDTIVIKNEYYPSGLTQKMVWDHYQNNKIKLLRELANRVAILFIFINENDYIIRRFIDYKLIYITPKNYNYIISGRTVSISVETPDKLDYFCLDIDPVKSVTEDEKKEAVKHVIDLYTSISQVTRIRVVSTSSGYHVYGYLKTKMDNSVAINFLRKKMLMNFSDTYGIGERRKNTKNKIVIDFTPMYHRGSHVVPFALNRNGLMCMDITKNWESFNRKESVIK